MKSFLVVMVVLIIGVGAYYFWLQSKVEATNQENSGTQLQVQVKKTPENGKYIPPGAVMEDGTI